MAALQPHDFPAVPSHVPTTPSDTFQVGASVRLVGLATAKYNSHVGRVVKREADDGRVGVELHGVAWATSKASSSQAPHLALKPSNLRHCPSPLHRPDKTTFLGTLSSSFLHLLLGERGWGLPFGVIGSVVEYLSILRVSPSDLSVTCCSSTRGDFPIHTVLEDTKGTWWISAEGAFVNGCGEEFLEFSLGSLPRRVSFVGISIPPYPSGPLSVRRFHLAALAAESTSDGDPWERVQAESFMTLDEERLQEFALIPSVETTKIRLYCTQNALADIHSKGAPESSSLSEAEEGPPPSCWCVGLFKVRFA